VPEEIQKRAFSGWQHLKSEYSSLEPMRLDMGLTKMPSQRFYLVMQVNIPLGPTTDSGRSKQQGGARLVNCYAEKTDGGKTAFSINTDPGLKLFSTVASGQTIRGAFALGNLVYVVAGETLYTVAGSGIPTAAGVVLGSETVLFSVNRKGTGPQIVITADAVNYVVENNVLSVIADVDLPPGVHSTAYINGYTLYGVRDGTVYVSAKEEATSVGGLDFFEAERTADGGVRIFVVGEEVWYFGSESLEIFRDSGDGSTQPFRPVLGAGQGQGSGCLAKTTVAYLDSTVFWVTDYRIVVRANGYSPQRISNHAVERDIEAAVKAGTADKIVADVDVREGHQYYFLRHPDWCWRFDAATDTWQTKTSYQSETWNNYLHFSAFQKNLVCGVSDGKVYEYTKEVMNEAGTALISKIISPVISQFPNGQICDCVDLDIQAGTGRSNADAHTQAPTAILRVSVDGGMTYGREYMQPMGRQGQWRAQLKFSRLGRSGSAGFVFEFSFPDPVERAIFRATASIRQLSS
jgi:hypothetical protein